MLKSFELGAVRSFKLDGHWLCKTLNLFKSNGLAFCIVTIVIVLTAKLCIIFDSRCNFAMETFCKSQSDFIAGTNWPVLRW